MDNNIGLDSKGGVVFNLGLLTVQRINLMILKFSDAYASQDWETAFTQLDLISQELDPFLDKEEKKENEKKYNELQKELSELQQTMTQAPTSKNMMVQSDLPRWIREWSLILRGQAYEHKLLMPRDIDPRFLAMRG